MGLEGKNTRTGSSSPEGGDLIRDILAANEPGPVDLAFGLSRANYFVLPRLVMQNMSDEWQRKFLLLVADALDEFRFDAGPGYDVRRRNASGTFAPDPLADYRHGTAPRRTQLKQEAS